MRRIIHQAVLGFNETGFIKVNCSRCFGRGHVWRYGKTVKAAPCPRCGGSGCELQGRRLEQC